jgi:sialic acid synthase SpsE
VEKTHIIAELAWGHDGSIDQAIEILIAAKKSGANSFSIHLTDLPNYMVTYYGSGEGKVSSGREDLDVYKYLEGIDLSNKQWIKLAKTAKDIGIDLCVMPNDIQSLEFSEKKLNPHYYVVSPACFVEVDMLEAIAKTKKKTFFRIGGSYLSEIESAISVFRKFGNEQIVLLHGFQNYPTKIEETDLALLKSLKDIFNVEVGLADHIDGGSSLAKIIPILALPYGATYIEKHITLDREIQSEDFESALNPADFKEFVDNVRASEIAIGSASFKELSEVTQRYRKIVRKRIVAKENIKKDTLLSREHLIYKRCDVGLSPENATFLIGRRTIQYINKDDVVDFSNVQ